MLCTTQKQKKVSKDEWYALSSNGGTAFAPAYRLLETLLGDENTYVLHYSDGDTLSQDRQDCFTILDRILPRVNLFGYGEIADETDHLDYFRAQYSERENVAMAHIKGKQDISTALKAFLGKGK